MIFSCCASWLTIQVCTLNLSFPGTVTIWLTNILYALHVLTNFTLELFSIESESTMNSHLSTNQTMCLTRTFQPTNHDCKQTYLAPSVSLLIDIGARLNCFSILCPLTVRAGNHMNQSHLETCGRRQAVICTGCFCFYF